MPDSLAMIRNGIWPPPVYETHFDDGTVERLSFWSRAGKPLDVDRGRRLVGLIYPGKIAVDGFVEHDPADMARPWHRSRDPFFSGEAMPKIKRKRGPTAKQCLAVIARLIEGDERALEDARALLAA